MLKYKGSDIVVYFSDKEKEYRRVNKCWEVLSDGTWKVTDDCNEIEIQYKKRTKLRALIKRRDELNIKDIEDNKQTELSSIVRELISIIGITKYVDSSSQKLLDMLDSGEIELN